MKKKIIIRFLKDKPKEISINIRDKDLIDINNLNHSHVFINKKKYTRKVKHRRRDYE